MQRILVTRAAHQASTLAEALRHRGVDAVQIPVIEIVAPQTYAALDDALRSLSTFDWLIFTSANAVRAFHARNASAAANGTPRIAAIGAATAAELQRLGLTVTLQAKTAVAESLAEALLPFATRPDGSSTRMLLVRAEAARNMLPEVLRSAGADVTVVAAYRNAVPAEAPALLRSLLAPAAPPLNAVTFTSASSVHHLLDILDAEGLHLPPKSLLISIGPITSAAMRERGLRVDAEAPTASIDALAEVTIAALNSSLQ